MPWRQSTKECSTAHLSALGLLHYAYAHGTPQRTWAYALCFCARHAPRQGHVRERQCSRLHSRFTFEDTAPGALKAHELHWDTPYAFYHLARRRLASTTILPSCHPEESKACMKGVVSLSAVCRVSWREAAHMHRQQFWLMKRLRGIP